MTLPIFEKKQEGKLWRRKFFQYVKLIKKSYLKTETSRKLKKKDLFIWALGLAAVTELRETVRDEN